MQKRRIKLRYLLQQQYIATYQPSFSLYYALIHRLYERSDLCIYMYKVPFCFTALLKPESLGSDTK